MWEWGPCFLYASPRKLLASLPFFYLLWIRSAMRRWLVLLLLIMLPLQANWAALSAYCQHEQDAQSQHIGHHSHQHRAVTAEDAQSVSGDQHRHADCSSCLVTTLTPLVKAVYLGLINPASLPSDLYASHPLFRPTTPPERPDWSRLA